jgi:hypothetical protein
VTGAGNYGSGDFKPSAPGLYRWIAAYSGDAANDAAAGHCNDTGESVLVTAAPQTQPDPEATPDSKAPETTITKKSDAKTTKRKVKFKFEADESATFECKLDRADFEPCTSPEKTKKLDFGKHKFQVRATDAAGNVDQTPAKDKFKVKKKR